MNADKKEKSVSICVYLWFPTQVFSHFRGIVHFLDPIGVDTFGQSQWHTVLAKKYDIGQKYDPTILTHYIRTKTRT